MRIELEIEQLILHDFPAHERQRIAAAIERELARLIEQEGLLGIGAGGLWLGELAEIEVDAGLKPDQIGARVAEQIYDGLRQEKGI